MNLREGTRRLAILLGVVGALAAAFVSYLGLEDNRYRSEKHNKFEQLSNSPVVQQKRKELTSMPMVKNLPPGYTAELLPSVVNSGGIKQINWTKEGYAVDSLILEDGDFLSPTPAPSVGSYLGYVVLPLIGFLVPWAVVRAIAWMIAGFSHQPPS